MQTCVLESQIYNQIFCMDWKISKAGRFDSVYIFKFHYIFTKSLKVSCQFWKKTHLNYPKREVEHCQKIFGKKWVNVELI